MKRFAQISGKGLCAKHAAGLDLGLEIGRNFEFCAAFATACKLLPHDNKDSSWRRLCTGKKNKCDKNSTGWVSMLLAWH